jgi:hypoxanthine phosphoribosyltransferase
VQKRIVSYDEYGKLLDRLVKEIKSSTILHKFKYVYGIPRGGLPISIHLAHFLNLEYIDDPDYYGVTTLIVDDIADTGKTLKDLGNHTTATLFYKERSIIKPTFYVEQTKDWIVFPWEKFEEIPNRPE